MIREILQGSFSRVKGRNNRQTPEKQMLNSFRETEMMVGVERKPHGRRGIMKTW